VHDHRVRNAAALERAREQAHALRADVRCDTTPSAQSALRLSVLPAGDAQSRAPSPARRGELADQLRRLILHDEAAFVKASVPSGRPSITSSRGRARVGAVSRPARQLLRRAPRGVRARFTARHMAAGCC
jgi:hypothetical protein